MTTALAPRGRATRPSHGGAALLAAVVGLALGRFLFFSPAPPHAAPATAAAAAPADAVAALEARVAAVPDDGAAWQQLAAAYLRRAAETSDPAFYGLAERALDRGDSAVVRGTLALARHQFAQALELGERAVEANPYDDAALGVVVDAQVELGLYDDAARSLQEMLDLRPGLAALARVSYLRQLHGDLPGAIAAMQQAVAAGSGAAFDRAGVLTLLGDLHFARGDLARADDAYEDALAAFEGLPAAVVGRAKVLAATGTEAEAAASIETLLDRVPLPAAALLLAELDPGSDAVALVRTLTALQEAAGQDVDLEMALFEADHGDPERAVELARRAHRARPDNVFAADALAWALHRAGDAGGAAALLPQVLRLGTGNGDALLRYHAAAIRASVGDRVGAARDLEAAFALNPWFSFGLRAEARGLAAALSVPLPGAWSR